MRVTPQPARAVIIEVSGEKIEGFELGEYRLQLGGVHLSGLADAPDFVKAMLPGAAPLTTAGQTSNGDGSFTETQVSTTNLLSPAGTQKLEQVVAQTKVDVQVATAASAKLETQALAAEKQAISATRKGQHAQAAKLHAHSKELARGATVERARAARAAGTGGAYQAALKLQGHVKQLYARGETEKARRASKLAVAAAEAAAKLASKPVTVALPAQLQTGQQHLPQVDPSPGMTRRVLCVVHADQVERLLASQPRRRNPELPADARARGLDQGGIPAEVLAKLRPGAAWSPPSLAGLGGLATTDDSMLACFRKGSTPEQLGGLFDALVIGATSVGTTLANEAAKAAGNATDGSNSAGTVVTGLINQGAALVTSTAGSAGSQVTGAFTDYLLKAQATVTRLEQDAQQQANLLQQNTQRRIQEAQDRATEMQAYLKQQGDALLNPGGGGGSVAPLVVPPETFLEKYGVWVAAGGAALVLGVVLLRD